MKIVWYENKALVFCPGAVPEGAAVVYIRSSDDLNPANLLQKFENSNMLYIVSDEEEKVFAEFLSFFLSVEAAGGIVEDREGKVLVMQRRGRADFPKGHVEKGETHEQTALREVSEETGLVGLSILQFVGTTQHFYNTYGRWEMKRTWWYRMNWDGTGALAPQTEEDITKLEWLKGAMLWAAVNSSFGTIKSIFDVYLQTKQE